MMRWRGTRLLAYKALKLLGVEISPSVPIGKGFRLPHGAVGLVIGGAAVIGDNVKVFQGVTLGWADEYLRLDQIPADIGGIVVEDNVVIGAGAKILHKCGQTLVIGRGAVIGVNAVVLKSVPAGEVWAGVPARKVGANPNALNLPNPDFAANLQSLNCQVLYLSDHGRRVCVVRGSVGFRSARYSSVAVAHPAIDPPILPTLTPVAPNPLERHPGRRW